MADGQIVGGKASEPEISRPVEKRNFTLVKNFTSVSVLPASQLGIKYDIIHCQQNNNLKYYILAWYYVSHSNLTK